MQDLMQPIGTPDGLFHDGNPATGELGTLVSALWLNAVQGATRSVQAELLSILAAAGITLDPSKNTQVLDAIKKVAWGGDGSARPTTLAGYGITDAAVSLVTTNCNTVIASGLYNVSVGAVGWPFGASGGCLISIVHGLDYQVQMALSVVSNTILTRIKTSISAWGAWTSICSTEMPIGVPLPWPLATPPAGWAICQGQSFNVLTYPFTALAYPSGVLPDLRANAIRGADNGRGVDAGRVLMSEQLDAIQNITGTVTGPSGISATGAFSVTPYASMAGGDSSSLREGSMSFDASRVVRTAAETRMRNLAMNYIVRML